MRRATNDGETVYSSRPPRRQSRRRSASRAWRRATQRGRGVGVGEAESGRRRSASEIAGGVAEQEGGEVMGAYQPKTGAPCSCKRGAQRDNCPTCEGTG